MIIESRYTVPTKFEPGAHGTIVKVLKESGDIEHYIQVGTDDTNWVTMGDFFVAVFGKQIDNDEFMANCLKVYDKKPK